LYTPFERKTQDTRLESITTGGSFSVHIAQ
jgi:hypothetical protein